MSKYSDTERLKWVLKTLYEVGGEGIAEKLHYGYGEPPTEFEVDDAMRREEEAKRPKYIGDFVTGKVGHTWTAEDAEEVMRQFRRVDELAQELIRRAREGK